MSNLYEKIMELCKERGITGGKLCNECGVSRGILTELKTGRSKNLTLKTAKKFADYLEVPIDTFFDEPTGVEEIQDELFEKRKILFELSKKATEEDLDKFIAMWEIIKGSKE